MCGNALGISGGIRIHSLLNRTLCCWTLLPLRSGSLLALMVDNERFGSSWGTPETVRGEVRLREQPFYERGKTEVK